MWYLNTRKNTIFLHVKISIISLTSGLSLKLYLNSLVYHRNIFGSSSKVLGNLRKSSDIFGNFRKFLENVRERSSGLRDNLNNLRKASENHQKRRHRRHRVIFSIYCHLQCGPEIAISLSFGHFLSDGCLPESQELWHEQSSAFSIAVVLYGKQLTE